MKKVVSVIILINVEINFKIWVPSKKTARTPHHENIEFVQAAEGRLHKVPETADEADCREGPLSAREGPDIVGILGSSASVHVELHFQQLLIVVHLRERRWGVLT